MATTSYRRCLIVLTAMALLTPAAPAHAQEVMCDPSFQDCHTTLLAYVRGETVSIDLAMWFMEDQELARAIVASHQSGVRVRALVDPRRNSTTPMNATTLKMFQDAGIPMRYKVGGGIMHWKYLIFGVKDTVQFSAANYGDYYFKPATPYLDYTDEGIFFSDDQAIVNSFRRKFDDSWIDRAGFLDYANISGTPARAYPLYMIDPSMSFVPVENFSTRSVPLYDAETDRIDTTMYKITESTHADGLIRAVKRGVAVRLITEPERYRNPANVWHAYHVDRLYMAGVRIRHRAHAGFLHQKSTQLYSQHLTIFGSSNWTSESNTSQYEHNYFTHKDWFFEWFTKNFQRKWGNTTGNIETKVFEPLPPTNPSYVSPVNGAADVPPGTGALLTWQPGPWAHYADVYFGTAADPPLLRANLAVSPSSTKKYALPALESGKTYYWRIVSKTMALRAAPGATYSFRTTESIEEPPPPPPPPPSGGAEIVLYAGRATAVFGNWSVEADSTAAGDTSIRHPNASGSKVGTALGAPVHYFELTFNADKSRAYRLWIRGKADSNSWSNDSVHVQFSGSTTASGTPTYRIGTSSSTEFNLEECGGCGVSGWGWEDNGWGTDVAGASIYFAATGAQTLRIQTREDGLAIDQIVLSPGQYLTASPGARKNDTVKLPAIPPTPSEPPPPSGEDIVLHAAQATVVGAGWVVVSDTTAASGARMWNRNAGAAKVSTAAISPATYFDMTFNAEAGRPYRLWMRGKAEGNSWSNDSVHVQFSGSVNAGGGAVYRIGTALSTEYNLESCGGCGLSGWGWEDNGWGTGVLGPVIYFSTTGTQTVRVQTREDGLSIDRIVLSPSRYLNTAPGSTKNDETLVLKTMM